jgi:hypothetical protein
MAWRAENNGFPSTIRVARDLRPAPPRVREEADRAATRGVQEAEAIKAARRHRAAKR